MPPGRRNTFKDYPGGTRPGTGNQDKIDAIKRAEGSGNPPQKQISGGKPDWAPSWLSKAAGRRLGVGARKGKK